MKGYTIVEDFLDDPSEARSWAFEYAFIPNTFKTQAYTGETYVVHPQVNPKQRAEFIEKVSEIAGKSFKSVSTFYRLSPYGVAHPNPIHNDLDQADVNAVVYLSLNPLKGAGTRFFVPKDKSVDFMKDSKNEEKWNEAGFVEMVFNRAVVFDAHLHHRSEPILGFGKTQQDSRLVLVGFFK